MRVETMSLGTPVQSRQSILSLPAAQISWRWWAVWLACFGAFSMMAPRDASFDVAHYHLHNGWAALNGRNGHDLAPAELHSFLNPAWQLFVWLLVDNLPGRLVAFILGILQGLSLPALYALTRRLLDRAGAEPSQLAVLAIAAAGFTAEAQFGLMATVRNDAVCAAAFLGALVMLVPAEGGTPGLKRLGLASLLMGALLGMKLTNSVYVLYFALAALIMMPDWTARFRGTVICAVAGLAGIVVTGGPWAWAMYADYQNPIFPFMNSLFDAPLGPDMPFRDARYVPGGPLEAMVRPFVFLFDGNLVNEHHFFDPRLQLGYLGAFAVLGFAIWKAPFRASPAVRPAMAIASGLIVTIIAWGLMFSIARYLVAAWLIGPTVLALALAVWKPGLFSAKYATHGALVATAALFLATQPSDLRRVGWSTWTGAYVEVELPKGADYSNATVAFAGGYPSAFLAPFFPESTRLTHLVPQVWSAPALDNYRYQIRDLIREPGRNFHVVIVDTEGHFEETLERLSEVENVAVTTAQCEVIRTTFDTSAVTWRICPAVAGQMPG